MLLYITDHISGHFIPFSRRGRAHQCVHVCRLGSTVDHRFHRRFDDPVARAQSTRAFARNLERLTDLPIGFWDERLSTVAAERALLEADTSRKRRAEVIDQVAAGYILQGALDRLRYLAR